jgi:hypothetical protein
MEYIDIGSWRDDIKNGQQTAEKQPYLWNRSIVPGVAANKAFHFIFNGIRAKMEEID